MDNSSAPDLLTQSGARQDQRDGGSSEFTVLDLKPAQGVHACGGG